MNETLVRTFRRAKWYQFVKNDVIPAYCAGQILIMFMKIQREFRYLIYTLFLGLVAQPVMAGPHHDVKDTVRESFKVDSGGTLSIDLDFGNVEIETTSDEIVQIELERIVNVDSDEDAREFLDRFHDYDFKLRGDDVTIVSKYVGGDRNRRGWRIQKRLKIRLKVRIPEEYNVDFETGAGNITLSDLDGELNGVTGAGNVTIGRINGIIDVSSGAGNISVIGGEGRVELHTGAGNIDVESVKGHVIAQTGAGNVTAKILTQPEEDSRFESGAGNVTVYLEDDLGMYVSAVASMGSASCDFPLNIRGKWMSKSFEGDINGGGPDLYMVSGVGNVTLRRR